MTNFFVMFSQCSNVNRFGGLTTSDAADHIEIQHDAPPITLEYGYDCIRA